MTEVILLLVRLGLGLAGLTLLGYALTTWLAPAFTRLERTAAGFGLGALVVTLWMLALSALGLPFHLLMVLGPPLGFVMGLCLVEKLWGARGRGTLPPLLKKDPAPLKAWDWVFFGLLAALFLFATFRAVLYPLWSWDAFATWGFKAKVFFLRETVDLNGFEAHNYYPNLVPLLLTYLYLWLGQVNDHLVKLVFPLWGGLLLMLLYGMLGRLGLSRTQALGTTTFFALNGITFISHLYITYADLALTYYTLGAAGFIYLWLTDSAPPGSLPLAALFFAGMPWCKFEGPPLAGTIILGAGLSLAWLRPPHLTRRLLSLAWPLLGLLLGYLPWRLFAAAHGIETGADHVLGFYPQQLLQALPPFLAALFIPTLFGVLWPAAILALFFSGKKLFTTPRLYLALFLGGNFLAILLAYALAPTSPFEFQQYVRATLDRLLLHLAPLAALLVGLGVTDVGGGLATAGSGLKPAPTSPSPQPPSQQ